MTDEIKIEGTRTTARRMALRVRQDDNTIKLDEIDILKEKARDEFTEKLCTDFPGVASQRAEVVAELLNLSDKASTEPWQNATSEEMEKDPIVVTVEPWEESVNGAEVLDDMLATIRRFVVLTEKDAVAIALWVLASHAQDAWDIFPFLVAKSATKRCGKTRLVCDLLQRLVQRALVASLATSSVIFRVYADCNPVLILDEADRWLKNDNHDLIAILDAAHTRSGAYVLKSVIQGDDWVPKKFPVFGPKVVGVIESRGFADTLQDRSITINMRRKHRQEHVEKWREKRAKQFIPLCRKAARWAADNLEILRDAEPEISDLGSDRAEDNWSSLLACADLAGGRWPKLARAAARALTKTEAVNDEVSILLLEDLRSIFAEKNAERLPTAELVESLVALEERPWSEWRKGKPITANGLAQLLRPFEVGSKNIKLATGRVVKGYYLDGTIDAFKRYLPDPPLFNRYPATEAEVKANSEKQTATTPPPVADEKPGFPFKDKGGSGVAARNPPDGGSGEEGDPGFSDDDITGIPPGPGQAGLFEPKREKKSHVREKPPTGALEV